MDILIVLAAMVLLIGIIAVIVMQLLSMDKKINLISKVNLILFVFLVLAANLYQAEKIIDSFEAITLCYMIGSFFILMWKVMFAKARQEQWFLIWAGMSLLYFIAGLINGRNTILDSIVQFGVVIIPGLFILAVLCLIKKNKYGGMLSKLLGISYLIAGVLFCINPPNDMMTILTSAVLLVLLGIIPGAAIRYLYKRSQAAAHDFDGIMNEL